MYLEHFGLREAPFGITPHTGFFFAGANRGATLEALIYAITHDEGIVKVSGEVGSGKTMLCRMLLEKLPASVETVFLANPSLSRDEMLYAIAEELHTPLPEIRPHQLWHALQERLIELYAAGRQVVVMIDEAHAMPAETLEGIRLLSNLESNRHKLLHIVLFGQPELDDHLRQMNMRQLKERITHNFALEPLHRNDISRYLMFRLRAAGYRGPELFTASAIARISRSSEGLTRRINILADKALLCAFAEDRHLIGNKQIKAAISDAQFNAIGDGGFVRCKPLLAAGILVLLAILAGLAASYRVSSAPTGAAPTQSVNSEAPDASAPPSAAARRAAPPAVAEPAERAAPPAASLPEHSSILAERLAASEEWLTKAPDAHYVIQLFNTDRSRQREVVEFLASNTMTLDQQQVHVYRSKLSGRERLGVVFGDYPSRGAANADLARVARASRVSTPYLRPVSKLR
jgi:MSHA biogenesis protein MshM